MQPVQTRSGFLQKQIPTLAGIAVLVVALVAGLFMFSEGTGVFAPRATPQTTPKQVKITNVADKAFTISFYTDEATAGFVKYGTSETELTTQASDDRDQLSGTVNKYTLHHITLKGLKPNTQYYFTLGTGSGVVYDNNGSPFSVKTTTEVSGPPPVAKTVYGTVTNASGTPADGSIVYVAIDGLNEMSTLVKPSGSWAISLANARNKTDGSYANLKDEDELNVFVQGIQLAQTTQTLVTFKNAQPVADLALGAGGVPKLADAPAANTSANQASDSVSTGSAVTNASASGEIAADSEATASSSTADLGAVDRAGQGGNEAGVMMSPTPTSAQSSLTPTPKPTTAAATSVSSTASAVLNLSEAHSVPIVTSESPKIMGQAPPRTQVKIEVHSDTQITQTVTTTDGGEFELDLSAYQNLEPGEHTVTISYIDPQTGQEVIHERAFIVEDKAKLALAGTGGTAPPYGSGNPFPVTSVTPTPTLIPTTDPDASDSGEIDTSSRSAVVSTTSGTYKSGSVGVTFALVGTGLFFILTGLWSWWLAGQVREEHA